jgi:hypothetical protein
MKATFGSRMDRTNANICRDWVPNRQYVGKRVRHRTERRTKYALAVFGCSGVQRTCRPHHQSVKADPLLTSRCLPNAWRRESSSYTTHMETGRRDDPTIHGEMSVGTVGLLLTSKFAVTQTTSVFSECGQDAMVNARP